MCSYTCPDKSIHANQECLSMLSETGLFSIHRVKKPEGCTVVEESISLVAGYFSLLFQSVALHPKEPQMWTV